MGSATSDAPATPGRLRALGLPPDALARALEVAAEPPDEASWRVFLSRVLLGLGALLVASGTLFFFAYNWAALPRLGKLALVGASVVLAASAASALGLARPSGRAALTVAATLVGALLAVYGQVYQTGADPYGLFLGWAALVLPWAVMASFEPLWLLVLLLVELALGLFWVQVVQPRSVSGHLTLFLALFAVNVGARFLWDAEPRPWMRSRWMKRTLATLAYLAVSVPAVSAVFAFGAAAAPGLVALILLAALAGTDVSRYARGGGDLFPPTLAATAAVVLFTCLAGRALLDWWDLEAAGFLVLAFVVILEVTVAGVALRRALQRARADP